MIQEGHLRDLRIGNQVFDSEGNIIMVSGHDLSQWVQGIGTAGYSPILLNDEKWYEGLGFQIKSFIFDRKVAVEHEFFKHEIIIHKNWCSLESLGANVGFHYLHELQNLMRLLTGRECLYMEPKELELPVVIKTYSSHDMLSFGRFVIESGIQESFDESDLVKWETDRIRKSEAILSDISNLVKGKSSGFTNVLVRE